MSLSGVLPTDVWQSEPSQSRVPLRVLEGVVRDDHARLFLQAFPVPGVCVGLGVETLQHSGDGVSLSAMGGVTKIKTRKV